MSQVRTEAPEEKNASFKKAISVDLLINSYYLVSVGNERHESESLKAIIKLFNRRYLENNNFNKIDILIAGTLQRHNFWNFSKNLSDRELANLLQGIPEHANLEEIAKILAEKFYAAAKHAEDDYIIQNKRHYAELHITPRFITWRHGGSNASCLKDNPEKITTIILQNGTVVEQKQYVTPDDLADDHYTRYHKRLADKYDEDEEFRKQFLHTIRKKLIKKTEDSAKEIELQTKRIATHISQLNALLQNDVFKLAEICSKNYLLEECPFFFPMLAEIYKYKVLIYPGTITEAFKATQTLFQTNVVYSEIDLAKPALSYQAPVHEHHPTEISFYRTPNENEKRDLTARYNLIKSHFTNIEKTMFENALRKYTGHSYNRSAVCALAFFVEAANFYRNNEYTDSKQYYQNGLLLSPHFNSEITSVINTLDICIASNDIRDDLIPRNFETLANMIHWLEVSISYKRIINSLSEPQREYYNNLCNTFPKDKTFYIWAEIFIAIGNEYRSRNENDEAKQYYDDALFCSNYQNRYIQIINNNKISPRISLENYFIPKALENLEVEAELLADFKLLQAQFTRQMNNDFQVANKALIEKLRERYRYSPQKADQDGMNIIHAVYFIKAADEHFADDSYDKALSLYKKAIVIMERFKAIWGRLDFDDLNELKSSTLKKITELEQLSDVVHFSDLEESDLEIETDEEKDIAPQQLSSYIQDDIDDNFYSMGLHSLFSVENFLRTIEFDNHPEAIRFALAVDDLDKNDVLEYKDCAQAKKDMIELVTKTLSQVQLTFPGTVPYNIFSPIFNRINESTLLNKHYRPIFDSVFGYRMTATKQKLLQLIRDTAMASLRVKLDSLEHDIPERKSESVYYAEVKAAKSLLLFSLNITNRNSIFLRPTQPPCCDEIDEKRKVIAHRQKCRSEAEEHFRRRW
jgi:hypothetical protein